MFRLFITIVFLCLTCNVFAENNFYISFENGYNKISPKDVNDDYNKSADALTIANTTVASIDGFSSAYSAFWGLGYVLELNSNFKLDSSISYNFLITNKAEGIFKFHSSQGIDPDEIQEFEEQFTSHFLMLREAIQFRISSNNKLKPFGGFGFGYGYTFLKGKSDFQPNNWLIFFGETAPDDYEISYKGSNIVIEVFAGSRYSFLNNLDGIFRLGYRVLKCSELKATKDYDSTKKNDIYEDYDGEKLKVDLSSIFLNIGVTYNF